MTTIPEEKMGQIDRMTSENNSWKSYVYIVFTTDRPLCHEVYTYGFHELVRF
jgi:hypothetical protein